MYINDFNLVTARVEPTVQSWTTKILKNSHTTMGVVHTILPWINGFFRLMDSVVYLDVLFEELSEGFYREVAYLYRWLLRQVLLHPPSV